jgi:5-methylcytosine-specific restriction endonuclease McrA
MDKKKKVQIPKVVKIKLWDTHFGEEARNGKCLCCGSADISIVNYEAGHIIADANGGGIELENLKPICGACNKSMKTNNMEDFMNKWGYVKGDNWNGFGIEKVEDKVDKEEEVVENKVISCDVCDKEFQRPSHLVAHKNRKIPCSDNPKKCKYCNKTFTRQSTVRRHIQDCSCKQEKEQFYIDKMKSMEEKLNEERQKIDDKLKEIKENKNIKV